MKKILLFIAFICFAGSCMAQESLSFPFQGGKQIMTRFFRDSLIVSPEIIRQKETGTVVFKFTADQKGGITKIIIYYADDAGLAQPVIAALKKSDHKWIIPDHEKSHDFIISFVFSFNTPVANNAAVAKALYDNYLNRKPIISNNQVPLDTATLLPVINIDYDIVQ